MGKKEDDAFVKFLSLLSIGKSAKITMVREPFELPEVKIEGDPALIFSGICEILSEAGKKEERKGRMNAIEYADLVCETVKKELKGEE